MELYAVYCTIYKRTSHQHQWFWQKNLVNLKVLFFEADFFADIHEALRYAVENSSRKSQKDSLFSILDLICRIYQCLTIVRGWNIRSSRTTRRLFFFVNFFFIVSLIFIRTIIFIISFSQCWIIIWYFSFLISIILALTITQRVIFFIFGRGAVPVGAVFRLLGAKFGVVGEG